MLPADNRHPVTFDAPGARVDCWAVSLAALPGDLPTSGIAVLSPHERQRAARFRFDQHRRNYIASHVALRSLLAHYLRQPPASLTIEADADGRPVLCAPDAALHFSLAHSASTALIAVSCLAPVGVDVEEEHDVPDYMEIARSHFARGEFKAIHRLPPEQGLAAFLATWTRKEAFVKALGLGLRCRLDSFEVAVPPDEPPRLLWAREENPAAWSIVQPESGVGHVSAVAIRHPDAEVRCRRAGWPWLLEHL